MKRIVERDRRQYPRFPQLLELQAREVQPLGSGIEREKAVVGRVQNVSKGGLCLIGPQPLARSCLVRCEIGVPELPVSIPTLMQVRWTRKQSLQADTYLTGLQFLL
ncbi:MAG: PilZ domain-containing protein [Candidatus Sulfotelmatobacter sp.]